MNHKRPYSLFLVFLVCLSMLLGTGWSDCPSACKGSLSPDKHADGVSVLTMPKLTDIPQPVQLPVLMYHHVDLTGDGAATIAADCLCAHLEALNEAGYHTVCPAQLAAFVTEGVPLPDDPILITFDDGYSSNYELAYPMLKKLNMQATIFVIGVHVGQTCYKDTQSPILPHFSFQQAAEMVSSGLITIGSHTYDLHQHAPYEAGAAWIDVRPLAGEDTQAYASMLLTDLSRSARDIAAGTGTAPIAMAYPRGQFTAVSESVRKQAGFQLSFTTISRVNTLSYGDPDCLALLGRYSVDDMPAESLLAMLEAGKAKQSSAPADLDGLLTADVIDVICAAGWDS